MSKRAAHAMLGTIMLCMVIYAASAFDRLIGPADPPPDTSYQVIGEGGAP